MRFIRGKYSVQLMWTVSRLCWENWVADRYGCTDYYYNNNKETGSMNNMKHG